MIEVGEVGDCDCDVTVFPKKNSVDELNSGKLSSSKLMIFNLYESIAEGHSISNPKQCTIFCANQPLPISNCLMANVITPEIARWICLMIFQPPNSQKSWRPCYAAFPVPKQRFYTFEMTSPDTNLCDIWYMSYVILQQFGQFCNAFPCIQRWWQCCTPYCKVELDFIASFIATRS